MLPTSSIIRRICLALVSGLGFAAFCYFLFYWQIDLELYANRDDGLITYSHVKNLFDFGFIGVSPSGERIEGYSNPLDFFLFSIYYALLGDSYSLYNSLKTYISLVGIGALLFAGTRGAMGLRLSLTWLSAGLFAFAGSFMQWHASGMEPPLSEFMMLAFLSVMAHMVSTGRLRLWYALPWLGASLVRAESIYYTTPLLLISLYLLIRHHKGTSRLSIVRLVAACILLYAPVIVFRWWYFGHILPDTAAAQGISIPQNLYKIVQMDSSYLAESAAWLSSIMVQNQGLLYIPALLIGLLFGVSIRVRAMLWLAGVLVVLSALHPFIFHAARLGASRYGAHLLPVVVAALVWAVSEAISPALDSAKGWVRGRHLLPWLRVGLGLVCAALIVGLALPAHRKIEQICCPQTQFAWERDLYLHYGQKQNWHRPMLANADLGLLSYNKYCNQYDIAYLGSPVAARFATNRALAAEYLYVFCRPHFLQTGQPWDDLRDFILPDRRFVTQYTHFDSTSAVPEALAGQIKELLVLQRDVQTPERRFYDGFSQAVLQGRASDILSRLKIEVDISLKAKSAGVYDAFYLVQTCYEFWPEIKRLNLTESVLADLDRAPGLAPAFARA